MQVRRVWGLVFGLALTVAACGDDEKSPGVTQDATTGVELDGSSTSPTGQDSVAEETSTPSDTTVAEDSSAPADTTVAADSATPVDTSVAEDSSTLDVPTPACEGSCFDLGAGPTNVVLTMKPVSETAPELEGLASGSAVMDGDYVLSTIDVYTKGTFAAGLVTEATLSNNGQTSGTNEFDPALWGYYLDLDLHYKIVSIAGTFEDDTRQMIGGGGCYTSDGEVLDSETGRCDSGWPDDAEPPSEFEFAYDASNGDLQVKIVLSKEFILSLLPEDNRQLAALAITGPLVFVVEFIRPLPL